MILLKWFAVTWMHFSLNSNLYSSSDMLWFILKFESLNSNWKTVICKFHSGRLPCCKLTFIFTSKTWRRSRQFWRNIVDFWVVTYRRFGLPTVQIPTQCMGSTRRHFCSGLLSSHCFAAVHICWNAKTQMKINRFEGRDSERWLVVSSHCRRCSWSREATRGHLGVIVAKE